MLSADGPPRCLFGLVQSPVQSGSRVSCSRQLGVDAQGLVTHLPNVAGAQRNALQRRHPGHSSHPRQGDAASLTQVTARSCLTSGARLQLVQLDVAPQRVQHVGPAVVPHAQQFRQRRRQRAQLGKPSASTSTLTATAFCPARLHTRTFLKMCHEYRFLGLHQGHGYRSGCNIMQHTLDVLTQYIVISLDGSLCIGGDRCILSMSGT